MNETLIGAFVIIACLAIVIQAGILVALYVSVRKTSARVEAVAEKAVPVLESAKVILDDTAPRLREITTNLSDVTGTIKSQITRLDATVSDLVDRSRLQIIRIDELVGRTMDKVEETSEMVQNAVVSPMRQLTGLMQGLSAGLGAYLSRRRRPSASEGGVAVDDDEELFI
jgi:ABC-type transporter Mla subunit MlaD